MSAELSKIFSSVVALLLFLSIQTCAKWQAKIKVTNISKCGTDSKNPVPWSFEMKNVDEEGYKIVNMEFDLTKAEFNEDVEGVLRVDKFNNGDWESDVYNEEGKLCEIIDKYVPKAWKKLVNKMDPKPKGGCQSEKEVYRLRDFEILREDINIPSLFGKIRGTIESFDKDNMVMFCGRIELEVTEAWEG